MYDTHCHLNFRAFADDYRDVIKNSLEKGIFLNIVGTQYETSRRAVEIAEEFAEAPIYSSVGLHPSHLEKSHDPVEGDNGVRAWDYEKYKKLGSHPKVVGIGETGIDFFRFPHEPDEQKRVLQKQHTIFREHIRLARELKKPLIIHCRPSRGTFDAYNDLLKIATRYSPQGVVHCFIGNWEIAERLLSVGLYISFTGIITFKNADAHLLDVVKKIPLDRVLIETDAPYLTPEPYRGKKRCEPIHVEYVAQKIAEIKELPAEKIIQETAKNAKKLFLNERTMNYKSKNL